MLIYFHKNVDLKSPKYYNKFRREVNKMELDKIKREERLQQFIKEERAKVLARRKAIVEKEKQGE